MIFDIPVVPDRCEVLRWKDSKWRDSGLNISSLFHPGSDQDRIQGLEGRGMSQLIMHFEVCDYYTVRAPEVCPTMHDERTEESSETISNNLQLVF